MSDTPKSTKRPRLDLPFKKKRFDPIIWAYDHRVALFATVAAYVLFGIAFVTADIVISRRSAEAEIMIDLTDLQKLQEELERAQELNRILNEQYEDSEVSNQISNDALDESLEDHRTDASKLYGEAERVQQRVQQNAKAYAAGLEAEQKLLNRHYEGEGGLESKKVKGKVTVSYSLKDPVRHALRMPVPAYMCQGGGEVVVNIVVNRNGEVLEAKIDESLSEQNSCLREAALAKAADSFFNADVSAPARQRGTISYLFISQ
ncbi:MAG: energy transducer TonB [Tidjanibacter sp.]|nr:energy transducer TonB [Tidjanibacter sp.]